MMVVSRSVLCDIVVVLVLAVLVDGHSSPPSKEQTTHIKITHPDATPPCCSLNVTTHFHSLNATNPFDIASQVSDPYFVITHGWLLIHGRYCSQLTLENIEFGVVVNQHAFPRVQMNFTGTETYQSGCLREIDLNLTLGERGDIWNFYSYDPKTLWNKISLHLFSSNFSFLIESGTLHLSLVQVDPVLEHVDPEIFPNPWNMESSYTITLTMRYYIPATPYNCTIRYNNQTVTGPLSPPLLGSENWVGKCVLDPPSVRYPQTSGKLLEAHLMITLDLPILIRYNYTSYYFYEQPRFSSIEPRFGFSSSLLSMSWNGIQNSSLWKPIKIVANIDRFELPMIPIFMDNQQLIVNVPDFGDINNLSACISMSLNDNDYLPQDCTANYTYYKKYEILHIFPDSGYSGAEVTITLDNPITFIPISDIYIEESTLTQVFNIVKVCHNNITFIVPDIGEQEEQIFLGVYYSDTLITRGVSDYFTYLGVPSVPSFWNIVFQWPWWLVAMILIFTMTITFLVITISMIRIACKGKDLFDIDPKILVSMPELQMRHQIGSGAYGEVFHGYFRKTEVAIKMLKAEYANEQKLNILQESSLQMNLHHPNIVALMGIVLKPSTCIITEFCKFGDLARIIFDKDYVIDKEHIRKFSLDTCLGMNYLHGAQMVHRDLKSRNLLIDKDWNIKVADFGLAAFLEDVQYNTPCGTPTHMAPEIIISHKFTKKSDVYSFAVCLYEMVARVRPYIGVSEETLVTGVTKKSNYLRPTIPEDADPILVDIMKKCWDGNPLGRPTFADLIETFQAITFPEPVKKKPWKQGTPDIPLAHSLVFPEDGSLHELIDKGNSSDESHVF